jgi:hypothetical protein
LKVSGLLRAAGRVLRDGLGALRRNALHFLAWGNTILGSLAEVIKAAEIIKEFKECVEHDLAEQNPPASP